MSVLVTSFHPLILKAHQLIFFLFHFRLQRELTYPYRPSSKVFFATKKFSYGYYNIEFYLMNETLKQKKKLRLAAFFVSYSSLVLQFYEISIFRVFTCINVKPVDYAFTLMRAMILEKYCQLKNKVANLI